MPDDHGRPGRSPRAPYEGDWRRRGHRRIRGGDLLLLLGAGVVVIGLILLNVRSHEELVGARASERMAWEQVDGLEGQIAELWRAQPGEGRAVRWAEVLDAPAVLPVTFEAATGTWSRGLYDPDASRLLMVVGCDAEPRPVLSLRLGTGGDLQERGTLDLSGPGRSVLLFEDVPPGSVVELTEAQHDGPAVVLRGVVP